MGWRHRRRGAGQAAAPTIDRLRPQTYVPAYVPRRQGRVAQSAEQRTFNPQVPGSNPGAPTNQNQ